MPITEDRNTKTREGKYVNLAMAASTKIYAGQLVAVNAQGYAVPASDTAGLKVIGIADVAMDNSAGAAGDSNVVAHRAICKLANATTNPVVQANIGSVVFVSDDVSVTGTSTNSVVAGIALEIEEDGVWVDTRYSPAISLPETK